MVIFKHTFILYPSLSCHLLFLPTILLESSDVVCLFLHKESKEIPKTELVSPTKIVPHDEAVMYHLLYPV
jgi:hypothetical protein